MVASKRFLVAAKRTSKYVLRWIEIFRKHSSRPNARFAKGLSHVKKREASRTRPDPAGERRGEERVFICLVGVPPGCVFFWHGKGRRYCTHLQKEKAELHLEVSQKGDGDDDDRRVWETGSSSKQQQRGSPTGK